MPDPILQIKFLRATDVDINDVPKSAWGKLQKRVTRLVPDFKTMSLVPRPFTGTSDDARSASGTPDDPRSSSSDLVASSLLSVLAMAAESVKGTRRHGPLTHYFRRGVVVDLPAEVAAAFISSGAAKVVTDPEVVIRMSEGELARWEGFATRQERELYIAGVILGYEEGSTPDNPKYLPGPNYAEWEAARRAEE